MAITALSLRNFRSFREAELRLRPFLLLVGRNAAGKSNLIHGFLFLRDIARSGLANAISLQGGLAYLQNAGLACGRDLGVEVELTLPVEMSSIVLSDGRRLEIAPGTCTYAFALGCNERAEVREDRFVMRFTIATPGEAAAPGSVEIVHEGDRLRYAFDLPPGVDEAIFLPPLLREARLGPDSLMLESPTLYPMGLVRRALALINCYEFGPRLTRRLDLRTGAAELAEDGSNAAIALGRVLAVPDSRRQFLALLRDLLPFVEDVVVGDGPGGAPEIRVAEVYAPGRYLPAEALSSGTVELFALLIALFFSPRELAIFEEPVARLHPFVVGRLVGLMREASTSQPLLVSTQHPAVLRHAPVEDVCLVSRDGDGFSVVSRPADRDDVRTFLEEEVGLDELFLADLLNPMPRLNVLVEGSDDVRFFERVLVPRLKERYGAVRLVPYACLRRTAVDRLLRGFARLGEAYMIVADIDTEPSVRAKKRVILSRFPGANPSAIAVVVMEIESWYLAGADDDLLARAGLPTLVSTDDLTKEAFNALIPRRYISRVGFMLDLLDGYSLERGADRNRSLSFFLHRFGNS